MGAVRASSRAGEASSRADGWWTHLSYIPPIHRLTRVVTALTRGVRHIAPGNEHVYRLSQELPDRVIPFHWVVLRRQGNPGELERLYDERRFCGLKLHQCWDRFRVASADFEAVVGSDTPYARDALRLAIERVRSLSLSDPEKDSVLGGNIRRLLASDP